MSHADSSDQAIATEQHILDMRVQAIRNQTVELSPIGECHWCDTPFDKDSPKLFCDGECATDWDKFNKK